MSDKNDNNDKDRLPSAQSGRFTAFRTKRPSLYRWFPGIVAVVSILCLIVVSGLLWIEWQERFPRISEGSYVGTIQGIFPDESNGLTHFYLESTSANNTLFFVVLRPDWHPQKVSKVAIGDGITSKSFYPVIVSGAENRLKFIGNRDGKNVYSGIVSDLDSGAKGIWKLLPVTAVAPFKSNNDREKIKRWLFLKAELASVERNIKRAEKRIPAQTEEITELTDFITEGKTLKLRAHDKYQDVMRELSEVKKMLAAKRKETDKLGKRIALSQRLTKMGKLVSLSRESTVRESRWVESMLRSAVSERSEDLDSEVVRAKAIMKLKQEISVERDKIFYLRERAKRVIGR